MKSNNTKSVMWGKQVLIAVTLILSASLAFAGPRKMSKDLESRASRHSGNVDVIVQFNHAPSTNDHKRVANHGGKLKRQLGHFRGALYTVSAARLAELANDPNVAFVSPDRQLRGASADRPDCSTTTTKQSTLRRPGRRTWMAPASAWRSSIAASPMFPT